MNAGPGDPLFPGRDGAAMTRSAVAGTFAALFGHGGWTEHSARRAGAQYYARRNVPVSLIQFIGRWGGDTVRRYIAEALHDLAATAPVMAATRCGAAGIPDLMAAVADLTSELRAQRASPAGSSTDAILADGARNLAASFAGALQAEVLAAKAEMAKAQGLEQDEVGGVIRSASIGRVKGAPDVVHQVFVGEAAFPIEAWVTYCGWRFGYVKHTRLPRSAPTVWVVPALLPANSGGQWWDASRGPPFAGRIFYG